MVVIGAYCGTPVIAEGFRSILKRTKEFSLSGVFPEMESLMLNAREHPPDILLLEVDSAVTLELLEEITLSAPSAATVLWVGSATIEFISQALALGVRGVLGSNSPVQEYAECLTDAHNGRVWVDKSVSQNLSRTDQVVLTPRQRQIMGLVSQGLHNKDIGWSLGLTEDTVKSYVSRLFDKCGVSDRFELALIALRNISASDQPTLRSSVIRNEQHRAVPHNIPRRLTT